MREKISPPTVTTVPKFSSLSMQPVLPMPGPFVHNDEIYYLDKPIGKGVSGDVWLYKTAAGKCVVLKRELPYPSTTTYPEGAVFQQEATYNKTLYGLGELSGDPADEAHPHYLLMPFFEGITGAVFLTKPELPPHTIMRVWILLAAAFHALHSAGIVHCDGHLNNVIISPNLDQATLIDFGYAHQINKHREHALSKEDAKICCHWPPETHESNQPNGKKLFAHPNQDVYALGYSLILFNAQLIQRNANLIAQYYATQGVILKLCNANIGARISIPAAIAQIIPQWFNEMIATTLPQQPIWVTIINSIIFNKINMLQKTQLEQCAQDIELEKMRFYLHSIQIANLYTLLIEVSKKTSFFQLAVNIMNAFFPHLPKNHCADKPALHSADDTATQTKHDITERSRAVGIRPTVFAQTQKRELSSVQTKRTRTTTPPPFTTRREIIARCTISLNTRGSIWRSKAVIMPSKVFNPPRWKPTTPWRR